ncbi:MAG: ABC transporter ATP-binding protein [Actinomycetota bacterium]|nr:ABC transporter ATP-binding protein [Actinomycetota bacterium]
MAEVAIACQGVWKNYRIYHQRSNTLKEKLLTQRNRYEEFWALKGIDLEVPVGTTFGIIGPNGSGKSTLLKTMARILTPDRGSVSVHGTMSSLLELGIGFHPELTGRENVYLGGSLLGLTRRDVEARFDDIIEFAGISEFLDMAVKNYSSGMYARLAFALAICVDPEVLLVDEVLSVGDENFQMRCHQRIAEFRAEGRTVVLVSHSLDAIRHLCSQAVWIDGGTIKDMGETNDVIASYLTDVHGALEEQGPVHSGHRLGSGEAVITDVQFFDHNGSGTTTFTTGRSLTVRLAYRAHKRIPNSLCCIALYRADDMTYVIGRSSKEYSENLELSGEGLVDFTLDSLPLLAGSYLMSIGIQDEGLMKVYDWHDRSYTLQVQADPSHPPEAGLVHVDGRWTVSPVSAYPATSPSAG